MHRIGSPGRLRMQGTDMNEGLAIHARIPPVTGYYFLLIIYKRILGYKTPEKAECYLY